MSISLEKYEKIDKNELYQVSQIINAGFFIKDNAFHCSTFSTFNLRLKDSNVFDFGVCPDIEFKIIADKDFEFAGGFDNDKIKFDSTKWFPNTCRKLFVDDCILNLDHLPEFCEAITFTNCIFTNTKEFKIIDKNLSLSFINCKGLELLDIDVERLEISNCEIKKDLSATNLYLKNSITIYNDLTFNCKEITFQGFFLFKGTIKIDDCKVNIKSDFKDLNKITFINSHLNFTYRHINLLGFNEFDLFRNNHEIKLLNGVNVESKLYGHFYKEGMQVENHYGMTEDYYNSIVGVQKFDL